MAQQPYFAPTPKQFPQRAAPPQQKVVTTTDPKYQLICPCGGETFDQAVTLYKVPGQVVGTIDLSWAQTFVCRECNMPLNVKETKTRSEMGEPIEEGA